MKLQIEIDENEIAEMVKEKIVQQIMTNSSQNYQGRSAKFGVRDGIDKGVKQYIYSNKAEIIERVVERASKEIVRKGLPKLLEGLK